MEVLTLASRAETLLGKATLQSSELSSRPTETLQNGDLASREAETLLEEETLLNSDAKSTSSTEYENSWSKLTKISWSTLSLELKSAEQSQTKGLEGLAISWSIYWEDKSADPVVLDQKPASPNLWEKNFSWSRLNHMRKYSKRLLKK